MLSDIVFVLILMELYRLMIYYLREHRISVALTVEVALVSILREVMLKGAYEFEWLRLVGLSLLLGVLGGLLAMEHSMGRWRERDVRSRCPLTIHRDARSPRGRSMPRKNAEGLRENDLRFAVGTTEIARRPHRRGTVEPTAPLPGGGLTFCRRIHRHIGLALGGNPTSRRASRPSTSRSCPVGTRVMT